MPDPAAHPEHVAIRKVARTALVAGVAITLLKFGVFAWTNSAAVLSDAMESIINVAAAGFLVYTVWLSNRPADREHPYGHGKVEFMAIGLEGWLILTAGVTIAYVAVVRLFTQPELDPGRLDTGVWALGGIGVLGAALAGYVVHRGRRLKSDLLVADGKHLLTDVASTVGVVLGLVLVRYTGKHWLDPLVALVMAALILWTSWRLLWQSIDGLMDRTDPKDQATIVAVLDDEVSTGAVRAYHKVRHRHNGPFHWVDMHLVVDADLTVLQGHELASRIERRIEAALGQANATAHLEPFDPNHPDASRPDAGTPAGEARTDALPQADPPANSRGDDMQDRPT